jgi:dihydropteroate synthase
MKYFFPEACNRDFSTEKFFSVAGTKRTFNSFKVLERNKSYEFIPAVKAPKKVLEKFIKPRMPLFGINFNKTNIMGILNVTPDSFYDAQPTHRGKDFVNKGLGLITDGLDILDVGGESTRPGAKQLSIEEEKNRVVHVVEKIRRHYPQTIMSIDTRKSEVAEAALNAGATIINDVSGFSFDPKMLSLAARYGAGICIMHSKGIPENMQVNPTYDDIMLDIFDFLEEKVLQAVKLGLPFENIIIDPGIGFGKNLVHNKTLLKNLGLFHGLGCPLMIGLSRKSFIGEITRVLDPSERLGGSIAALLKSISMGVQVVRVHDVRQTKQAIEVWNALE